MTSWKWAIFALWRPCYPSLKRGWSYLQYQMSGEIFFRLRAKLRWKKTGVALIAKFCVSIAFLGAVRILATSPCHHTQNHWTSVQHVTAHWWLPCHSTLDWFANSVWFWPWLCTPPWHKSSQWRAESGRRNKCAGGRYFGLYGATPRPPPPPPPPITELCML